MDYSEIIKIINDIEDLYDVKSVKYKDLPIWQWIRFCLYKENFYQAVMPRNAKHSTLKIILKTLFFYNPFKLQKYKYLLFTDFDRRKLINGRLIHRISGGLIEQQPNMLTIEKPTASQMLASYCMVKERNTVSESWLLILVRLISILLRMYNPKIENEDIIIKILKRYNLHLDYKTCLRLLISQRLACDILLLLIGKPKKVIIECPYPVMGYLWSFHSKQIEVIELQHGVINHMHFAYNSAFSSPILVPDVLCVFGETELEYAKSDRFNYCSRVLPIGMYYLELSDQTFIVDVFSEYKKKWSKIIVVSGQSGYETILMNFICECASSMKDLLFIYLPRNAESDFGLLQDNIILQRKANIYEYLKWCDIHCTIFSSTALEGHYFKKPTIFFNYIGLSTKYYGEILKRENGAFYINSVAQMKEAISIIDKSSFKYRDIYVRNNRERLQKIIS